MPKTVDREEQRRQIGAAVLRLASEQGLDEVSVRTVAAASGRSPGAVQKYFRTKDEMLAFAAELAGERVEERMAAVNYGLPPREALRALVLATLPVDAERRAEAAAQLAFATRAAHHPGLGAIRRQVDESVRTALGDWLASAGHGRDPDAAADRLALADAVIALSDGLALRLLYAPEEQEALLRALDHALDALIPPRSPSASA
ncbi:TetR/AcrR family transcriptional regulator [Streptomyces tubercidicus]|uniref:HTH-type transcriptional regulator PksA n=1 Tax=Streptomyces tubercidicus TaxID=47759 RepID=A0A640US94_9ACTN|nr:TetR/AcrR family transcriptional regulator [Streptomyces tubercidicus]WAU12819.1 TetR/AcrR family transcriptional regulator [Streptomyces tubercidicus]GFE38320.1 HTH-type transcriptional regulator PksA [Streptomyces tubercidicus]